MTIRPAVAADASRITALLHQLGYPEKPERIRDRLDDLGARAETAVLLAEDTRRQIIGCVHVMVDYRLAEGRRGEISSIVVDAGARERGVGAGLVAAAAEWLQARGIDRMRVRCNAVRERAHRFYERLGFETAKTQKVFDHPTGAPFGESVAD